MLNSSKARLVVLVLLLAVLTHIVYTRGIGWRLGGAAAVLRGPYSSEKAWVVGEIARDVTEMASFPTLSADGPTVEPVGGQPSRYRVVRPAPPVFRPEISSSGSRAGGLINLPQYRAINAFFKTDVMKITAWRTSAFEVTVTAPNRLMGIEFRTHPIKGWAEE